MRKINEDDHNNQEKLQVSLPINRSALKFVLFTTIIIALVYVLVTQPEKIINFFNGTIKLLSPFIIGFCSAYVINLLLRPLEKLWTRVWRKCKKQTVVEKFKRPVCLTLSFLSDKILKDLNIRN